MMESGVEQQQSTENQTGLCGENADQLTGSTGTRTHSQNDIDTNNNSTHAVDPCESLSILYKTLAEPIPDNPSPSYISDAAHNLVEGLNAKRKNDAEIVERFRNVLNAQTTKYIQMLEQKVYQMYDVHNSQVDKKLQELFARLDAIAATESEIANFRESLSNLYKEMSQLA